MAFIMRQSHIIKVKWKAQRGKWHLWSEGPESDPRTRALSLVSPQLLTHRTSRTEKGEKKNLWDVVVQPIHGYQHRLRRPRPPRPGPGPGPASAALMIISWFTTNQFSALVWLEVNSSKCSKRPQPELSLTTVNGMHLSGPAAIRVGIGGQPERKGSH